MADEAPRGSLPRPSPWVAFAPPAAALLLLLVVALCELDRPLFLAANALPRLTPPLLWTHLTILGDGLVCAVLLLPWIRKHPERIWGGILGALFALAVMRGFKAFLGLPRPPALLPQEIITVVGPVLRRNAFPSGHTTTAFLLAGIWAQSDGRRWVWPLALLLAGLVGLSRMAVGVHWPSDVLGGAALGWTAAWLGLRWGERWPWGRRRTGRRVLGSLLLAAALALLLLDHTGYSGVLVFQRILALLCFALGAKELARELRNPEH